MWNCFNPLISGAVLSAEYQQVEGFCALQFQSPDKRGGSFGVVTNCCGNATIKRRFNPLISGAVLSAPIAGNVLFSSSCGVLFRNLLPSPAKNVSRCDDFIIESKISIANQYRTSFRKPPLPIGCREVRTRQLYNKHFLLTDMRCGGGTVIQSLLIA